jgi:hypothetical protein
MRLIAQGADDGPNSHHIGCIYQFVVRHCP